MKRVKEIDYFKNIREVREFEFGVFYYFNGLVISEINEGESFCWDKAEKAVNAAHDIFGEDMPIVYISNRVNSYKVLASDWLKFFSNRNKLSFYSVVGNTKSSFASVVMERMFFKESLKQFTDLEEAIEWSLSKLKESKTKHQEKLI